ncbi:MAG TPA: pseudouridine synthase [Puia sp.]|nr:pseudouridine synthase [Puia sp.]
MKRKTDNFSKFYNKKSNAAIKEGFRQEKKAAKKERKEAIERHFEEKRKARDLAAEARFKKLPGKKKPPTLTLKDAPASGSAPGSKVTTPVSRTASTDPNAMPLNKYIAHGGLCSRRDAAELIRQGKVLVNGQLVTEPGTKVSPDDLVKVNGKKVTISRNFVYILLNKPKDYITTTDDPQGRKTVLDLIRQATPERVFPVGRLDRNTSGVLLLTNDGDLAQKLAHPKHEIKKIYHVALDKPLTKADFDKIASGVTLEDGLAYVDVVAYADARDKTQIGLEIHSGRNRIVRRIFEHLGYDVKGLDRVMYAGLTKKNVQRGHWRLLTEKEIRILKYLNSSFRGSLAAPKAKADEGEEIDTPAPARPAAPKGPVAKKFKRTGPNSPAGPKKPHSAGRFEKPAGRPEKSDTNSKKPPMPNGGLRGRKSSGSYIKSKAKSQQASGRRRPH